ncbi:hypothetical protein [Halomicrococcus sp. NG-SE-24]
MVFDNEGRCRDVGEANVGYDGEKGCDAALAVVGGDHEDMQFGQ